MPSLPNFPAGRKQRIAIAFPLYASDVSTFDEPTSAWTSKCWRGSGVMSDLARDGDGGDCYP